MSKLSDSIRKEIDEWFRPTFFGPRDKLIDDLMSRISKHLPSDMDMATAYDCGYRDGLKQDDVKTRLDIAERIINVIKPFDGIDAGCFWCCEYNDAVKKGECKRGVKHNFKRCGCNVKQPKEK